ncbi:MAG: ABC transporter ATP-binding protein [Burkholderiales bacterium]|nr:ABC transporter ATP-binding protein [Burkholderiales bacterium]
MEELLRVEHLSTWLATRSGVIAAVDDVSFTLGRGRTVALVGESGSGKSATCTSIVQLLPINGRHAGGHVWFKGEDLTTKTAAQMEQIRGSQIGMILQDPMTSLNPLFTVGMQVGEVFKYHGGATTGAERRKRAVGILQKVGIPAADERVGSYPHQFSGGMRQRVSIAMNVAGAPELLIADEPTTALDVTIRLQILQLLLEIQATTHMSIILVTHDLHTVASFCDDVIIMYAGRIVEQGPVEQVFARPGHPYTEGLLKAIPRFEGDADRLVTIPGQPPSLFDLPPGCRFAPRCAYATNRCREEYPDWFETAAGARRVACWLAEERLA